MTEPAPTPDDEQPTGSFEPVTADGRGPQRRAAPARRPPATQPAATSSPRSNHLAQDRPEALIAGAFAVGFALAMLVRRLVR